LEQISLSNGLGKAQYGVDGKRPSHESQIRSGVLAYLQKTSPPDLNFRILIPSLDKGRSEQILTAYLPCSLLKRSALSLGRDGMMALNSWQSAILVDYLITLAGELPSIPKEHWPRLGAVTCTLVQACLATSKAPDHSGTSLTTALRERLRCVVRQHMSSPDFGPEALCQLVAMSRSKLYRIFEGAGGVARFIQEERLSAARRRLADIGDKTLIRTLANEIGFLDHSTFSRAFKIRYGNSPKDFREMISANHSSDMPEDWLGKERDL
jgi:AraC-like DNA-binding protein